MKRILPAAATATMLAAAYTLAAMPVLAQNAHAEPVKASPAATPAPQIPNIQPDVQVVVLLVPTGEFAVATTYNKKVPQSEAEGRVRELLQKTGWKAQDVRFSNNSTTSWKRAPLNNLSSVSFRTTSPIVDWQDGTLALEPFLVALKDMERVNLTFIVPAGFNFRGLRNYENEKVSLQLATGQGTFTYIANIKKHDFAELNLPRYHTETASTSGRAELDSKTIARRIQMRNILLVGALALIAGIAVFVGTNRLTRR